MLIYSLIFVAFVVLAAVVARLFVLLRRQTKENQSLVSQMVIARNRERSDAQTIREQRARLAVYRSQRSVPPSYPEPQSAAH